MNNKAARKKECEVKFLPYISQYGSAEGATVGFPNSPGTLPHHRRCCEFLSLLHIVEKIEIDELLAPAGGLRFAPLVR